MNSRASRSRSACGPSSSSELPAMTNAIGTAGDSAPEETSRIALSVIMPVGKRHAVDIAALYTEYRAGLASLEMPYEFIIVLDGPKPEIAASLQRLLARGENLVVISLTKRFGEATALMAGFPRAAGRGIFTSPPYPPNQGEGNGNLVAALRK